MPLAIFDEQGRPGKQIPALRLTDFETIGAFLGYAIYHRLHIRLPLARSAFGRGGGC